MKTILFFPSFLLISFFAVPLLNAQKLSEETLYSKIVKQEKNDDIIDYAIDYPNGLQILEVEKILFKKCVKNQKEDDCKTYLDLFAENGQYVDQVMNIIERSIEEKEAKGEKASIFEMPNFPDLMKGIVIAKDLFNDDKPKQGPKPAVTPVKKYVVTLTFGASGVAKAFINEKEIKLTSGPKGKSYNGMLQAGNYKLRIANTSGQTTCAKLLEVNKSLTVVNPCLRLPNYPSR